MWPGSACASCMPNITREAEGGTWSDAAPSSLLPTSRFGVFMFLNSRRQFLARSSALGLLPVARGAWAQATPAWPENKPKALMVVWLVVHP